jgi:isopenicillin N synthase-like dioxygenase
VVETYIQELTALSVRFLLLVAEALSLPRDTFLSFLSDQHRLKLVRYPASSSNQGIRQGVGPHKDSSGWWTFLLQASQSHVKGLQVMNKNEEWIDVPILPGSFVVNIGQAFEVVTNGVCPATTHRVLSRPEERLSVPFFQGVRRSLTKQDAIESLKEHFDSLRATRTRGEVGFFQQIDSPFLKGKYATWGESQLRTKIRSHRDVGLRFYSEVFDKYVGDD